MKGKASTSDREKSRTCRSDETRARMIRAAMDVFGALGYEGASTRVLAQRAGVNLAAIPYHFGGKRELYMAAAQSLANYVRERVTPIIVRLRDVDRASHAARIDEALSSFFNLVVGGVEPKVWTSFVIRCENDADEAFKLLHEQIVARFRDALTETVAEAVGCKADDENLRLRVAIVLGSIIHFRSLRNMTLSNLGWEKMTPERLSLLDNAIRHFAVPELLSSPSGT